MGEGGHIGVRYWFILSKMIQVLQPHRTSKRTWCVGSGGDVAGYFTVHVASVGLYPRIITSHVVLYTTRL